MKDYGKLLEKHDKAGPRYTSYPTAPVWRDDFAAEELVSDGEDLGLHSSATNTAMGTAPSRPGSTHASSASTIRTKTGSCRRR